ncbi:rho guanine nucleotide exchange factor 11-like [Podarcis raffonei]|uniref:rho guanine nucleotide exchange factor 11-like n=1 Tax=Podarcis raffonei TaxID=65483 RepID=UPI0023296164|nr:rho guanine nucleotide exchange factor 11-like [Podarcis raffonei]
MKDLQEKEPLIEEIWDLLLSQFDVGASKVVQQSIIKFSLQQARALQFLRTKQRKDAHLQHFIQKIESCPECHHDQLKDFLESEMQT